MENIKYLSGWQALNIPNERGLTADWHSSWLCKPLKFYESKNCPIWQKEGFPYTPAEIENFCKRLDFVKKAEGENFKREDIIECVEMIIPLTKSAQDGLNKMVAQRELFIEI